MKYISGRIAWGLLTWLLSVFCAFSLQAQTFTLSGVILEKDSFTRVPFAVVSLKGKLVATTSDESGNFDIQCSRSDTLVLTHVGFQRMNIPVSRLKDSSGKRVKVIFSRKEIELSTVTISGKRLSPEKKEEYQRHLDRVRPSISSPISLVYESLSRRGKERTKMDEIYQSLILRDMLETRLPPGKLFLITGDRSVSLDDLLAFCPVSSEFAQYASDYEFFSHFTMCWKEFKRRSGK